MLLQASGSLIPVCTQLQLFLITGADKRFRKICRLSRPACNGRGGILFLSQVPYLFYGSLREQLTYPISDDDAQFITSYEELKDALCCVDLPHLQEHLVSNVTQDWRQILSLGEQQRLSFARIFVIRPRFVVMDEPTSSVDVATEARLFMLLIGLKIGILTVAHQESCLSFHRTICEISPNGDYVVRTR